MYQVPYVDLLLNIVSTALRVIHNLKVLRKFHGVVVLIVDLISGLNYWQAIEHTYSPKYHFLRL